MRTSSEGNYVLVNDVCFPVKNDRHRKIKKAAERKFQRRQERNLSKE